MDHDPTCTPAYLCDECITAIICADDDDAPTVSREIHNAAAVRAGIR